MNEDQKRWRALIAAAATDRDSGSWVIAKRAAEGLALAAEGGEAALRDAVGQLLQGQPSMAAVRNLSNAIAWAGGAAEAVRAFVARGDAGARATVERTAALLQQNQARRAATISASSAVEAALIERHGPVLALESRPRNEGRALAKRLAVAGIDVTLAVDAAARALLATGDVVVLGADSVTPQGITNKIGSWALAAAAKERRLPVYVLAGPEKWWPHPLPEAGEEGRDPGEVLAEPIAGVWVRNPYFELVPFDLITAIATPEGPLTRRQVLAVLASWRIHPWLAPPPNRDRAR